MMRFGIQQRSVEAWIHHHFDPISLPTPSDTSPGGRRALAEMVELAQDRGQITGPDGAQIGYEALQDGRYLWTVDLTLPQPLPVTALMVTLRLAGPRREHNVFGGTRVQQLTDVLSEGVAEANQLLTLLAHHTTASSTGAAERDQA